ncbi:hypothetical protein KGQ34_02240 [Patescibacteria group bacterium]|nr:hypothetical protein [Patescibacteria group bacterium]
MKTIYEKLEAKYVGKKLTKIEIYCDGQKAGDGTAQGRILLRFENSKPLLINVSLNLDGNPFCTVGVGPDVSFELECESKIEQIMPSRHPSEDF